MDKKADEVIKRIFADKIFELRTKKGLSQMELGSLLGIDRENIRKYEKGLQEPRLTTIVKFALALQIDFNELLEYDKIKKIEQLI